MGNVPFRKSDKYHPNPQRAMRKCLSCEREFVSEWIGNRMCSPCKGESRTQIDTYEQRQEHT